MKKKQNVFEEHMIWPKANAHRIEMFILYTKNLKTQQNHEFEFWAYGKGAHHKVEAYFNKKYNKNNEWKVLSVNYV